MSKKKDARIAELERECAGYKMALEAADKAGCTVIVVHDERASIRIYGPNKDREIAFAEQVARWFKLVHMVANGMAMRHQQERFDGVRSWAAALIPGNIEAQLVVDEIDDALKKEAEPDNDSLPDGWSVGEDAAKDGA